MDVGSAVVADEQSFELVKPGEGALDDPAVTAEPGAVVGASAGDLGRDAAAAELATVALVVIAAVRVQPVRASAWSADPSAHRRYPVDEGDQLGDVMAVTAGDRPGERDPGRAYEKVMLRAVSGSINRARACFGAPFFGIS